MVLPCCPPPPPSQPPLLLLLLLPWSPPVLSWSPTREEVRWEEGGWHLGYSLVISVQLVPASVRQSHGTWGRLCLLSNWSKVQCKENIFKNVDTTIVVPVKEGRWQWQVVCPCCCWRLLCHLWGDRRGAAFQVRASGDFNGLDMDSGLSSVSFIVYRARRFKVLCRSLSMSLLILHQLVVNCLGWEFSLDLLVSS